MQLVELQEWHLTVDLPNMSLALSTLRAQFFLLLASVDSGHTIDGFRLLARSSSFAKGCSQALSVGVKMFIALTHCLDTTPQTKLLHVPGNRRSLSLSLKPD